MGDSDAKYPPSGGYPSNNIENHPDSKHQQFNSIAAMTKIENEQQYRWALSRVEEILPMLKDDTPLTDPYSIELELLSGLVADYSDEHYAIGEPSLVDMLKLRTYV